MSALRERLRSAKGRASRAAIQDRNSADQSGAGRPVLREFLKSPHTYLVPVVLLYVLAAADSWRQPAKQVTGRLYVAAVERYQRFARPLLRPYIRCRYRPTCSEYSIQAVRKWGIRHGLVLTTERLLSCRSSVPLGTSDPVP